MGTTVPLQIKLTSQRLMVSTRNTSRSNANPPRMQDQPDDVGSRPPGGVLEMMQANTDEVEALHLTNQRLIGELEQLTRQMQRPWEARQTQEGYNITPQEGQPHLGTPRGAEMEAESSQARGHEPHLTPREEGNEETPEGNVRNDELTPPPPPPTPPPPKARNGGAIMGVEVQGPSTGAQPHEGSCKGSSS